MAGNYMGNITFGVNFDTSKGISQLKQMQKALTDIGKLTSKDILSPNFSETQLKALQTQAANISQAMGQSFNTAIGQIDMTKFNKLIDANKMSAFLLNLSKIGPVGYQAFNSLQKSLTQTNDKLKSASGWADKMLTTLSNTIRWSIATKALQTVTGSIQRAFYFTKELDTSLNDIRIVTSKSADEMEKFALQATKAAQALGKTTTDYTKASLLFYQQGLGDQEVAARAETTLKAANVTGQSTSEVSEQLTAVWNGYKVSAAETEKYVDKLSAVAASTASNLEELSTGMSKVASAANMMGVDIDQLNAQLSTVISVTRQAPETIGAAFKTIYARMSTIDAGGIDEEDGATLKSYTEKMNQFGFSVLDSTGHLRDMGDVIEEIGKKWTTLTREQQTGLAQAMGGTRQYSNITALFENWDKYQAALKVSQNATGTLQHQQEIYMDSIAAHMEQLTAEAENLYQTVFDSDFIKNTLDGLTGVVKTIDNIIKGFGGVENVIMAVGSALTTAFAPKIGQGISNIVNSFTLNRQYKEIAISGLKNTKAAKAISDEFYQDRENNINKNLAGKNKDQQMAELNMQKQLTDQINELDTIYYKHYNTLSEAQKQQIQQEKAVLESIRDENAEVAKLEEEYAKKASRVLKGRDVTTTSIKEESKSIAKAKQELKELNDILSDTENKDALRVRQGIARSKHEMFNATVIPNPEADFQSFNGINLATVEKRAANSQDFQQIIDKITNFRKDLATKNINLVSSEIDDLEITLEEAINKEENKTGVGSAQIKKLLTQLKADKATFQANIDEYGQKAINSKEKISQAIANGVKDTQKAVENITVKYETFKDRLPQEVQADIDAKKEELDSLLQTLNDPNKVANLDADEVQILINEINESQKQWMESLTGASKEFGDELEHLKEEGLTLAQMGQQAKAAADLQAKASVAARIRRQQTIQGSVQVVAAIGQIATSINMVTNSVKNFNKMNPLEIILQFTMMAPMVINSINAIKTGIVTLGTALGGAEVAAKGFGAALLASLPILIPLVAGVAALTAVIYLITRDPVDELAESLETAKENTKKFKEQTEALKQSYDDIASAFNKFDEASNVMLDAKSTTEEYNKALKESNEEILKLIENNQKLAKYFTRDSEGRLVLKEGVSQEDVKNKANEDYLESSRNAYLSENIQTNLQNRKDIRDFFEKELNYGMNAFSESTQYRNLGDFQDRQIDIQQFEMSMRDSQDKLTNLILNAKGPMTKEEWEEALASIYDPQLKATVEITNEVLDKLNTLVLKQDDVIASNKIRNQEIQKSLLIQGNYGDYNNQTNIVQQAIANVIGQTANIKERIDAIRINTTAEDDQKQIEELAQAYAKEKGLTYQGVKGDNVTFEDAEGETVTESVQYFATQAANNITEKAFEAYMEETGKNTVEQIEKINDVAQKIGEQYGTKNLGDALMKAFSGKTDLSFLNSLSVETGKKIKEGIENGQIFDNLNLDSLDKNVRDIVENAIKEALNKDYSLALSIQTEIDRTLKGYQAFNGLERQWYEDKKIDDETLTAIKDFLESLGLGDTYTKLEEAIGTGKWELISDAINDTKKIVDDKLKDTNSLLKELNEEIKKENINSLKDYTIGSHDSTDNAEAKSIAINTKEFLKTKHSYEDITKAIAEYQKALNKATDDRMKIALEQDLTALEKWKTGLENAKNSAEDLNDELSRQEKEVYNVVNQADGTKEAMLLIGEGWKVAAEDAKTFQQNCKNAELYIQQVNEDGSLQINEAGISDMAQRQFEALQNQIQTVEAELENAQQAAHNYTEGSAEWEVINQKIEEQVLLLSILRSSLYGLQDAINTAGTDHKASSGSTKKPIDAARSVLDIYHDINIVLKEITHSMTVLEKRSEYLTGKKLEKNLKNQLSLLKEQNKALQEKVKIAVNEAATLRAQKVNDDGTKGLSAYGVEFNKDTGEIENYYEVIRKKEAELESARLQFNKSRSDADEQHYNKIKKELDDLKQDISEYEKYLDDRRQLEEEMYDNLAKQLEIKLKHADLKIEAMVDLSKVKKQILEFQKNMGAWTIDLVLNPNQTAIDAVTTGKASRQVVTSSAKSMTQLTNNASELADVINFLKDAKAGETKEWNGEQWDRTAIPKLAEELEGMVDKIQDSFEDIKKTVDDARNAYINALQELQDWNQKVMEHYDMKNGMFDHADKLTSLLYGEDSLQARAVHENIATQKTGNLYNQAIEANKIAKESYQEYLDAVKSGDKKVAEEAYSIWSENIQKLNSLTEELVESRMNLYKTQVERIVSEFDMGVFDGNTMDEYISQWELLNKQADQYLDTINAEFGVEQLRFKYVQAYNKAIGNTKTREKINKIMNEELAMLKEKDKLTQYDLDRANAKYELTLKQIALEEARENKTNLRLRRDSQGNYTYQYTADEDEIAKAQNEVDIAKNNLYNMDKERTNEMVNETLQLYKDFAAEREAILNDPQYINDKQAMNEKLKELEKRYFNKDNGLISVATKEYAVAAKNVSEDVDEILNDPNSTPGLMNSFNTLVEKGPEAIDELVMGLQDPVKNVMEKFIPTSSGDSSIADGVKICFETCEDYQDEFLDDVKTFVKDLDKDTALGGVVKLYNQATAAVKAFKEQCEADIDLTQIKNVTTAIDTLAEALDSDSKPNLTGNADKAWKKLKKLINPENFKENLETIKKNFNKLIKVVDNIGEAFNTSREKADSLFTLLDEYNKKKWSFAPDINIPSGGGGSSQRGNGTPNDDGTGGDGSKGGSATPKIKYYALWNSATSSYFDNIAFEGSEQEAKEFFEAQNIGAKNGSTLQTRGLTTEDFKKMPYTLTIYKKKLNASGGSTYMPVGYSNSFDTGGYTGAWGDQGKLALLHEKELVLNKEDTQNILDAVDLIRQIDMKQMQMNMMENYITALQRVQDKYGLESSQPTQINQNITINADFPDATDRDEIKAAFDSLVNLASQRVMTKRH